MSGSIMDNIHSSYDSLTEAQQTIANFVIKDPLTFSFLSTKELSDRIGVSPASLVRFAKKITGGGFPQLQAELQFYIQAMPDPVKRMELNLITDSEDDAILAHVYETQIDNLRKAFNKQLISSVHEAARLISGASRIYTIGSRGSYSVAFYLGHQLNRVLNNTEAVQVDDRLADFMQRTTENDLVIMVCLPRYSQNLLSVAKTLKSRGTKIVTITDAARSPFVPYSDASLYAFYNSNDFHNSLVAPMLFCEMLLSLVISKNFSRARGNLDSMEKMFTELDQFYAGK